MLGSAAPPTQLIALRQRDVEASDQVATEALDLALRVGEGLISAGAPAADVTAIILRIAAAYGLTSCQVDITFTSLTLSVVREDGDPMTVMRIVHYRAIDYTRLAGLYDLSRRIADGLPLNRALTELDELLQASHPYRRWIVTGALAGMAAAVCGMLGGGWQIAIVAALTTILLDLSLRQMNRWGLPTFFQQATAAALVTCVAVGIFLIEPHVEFTLDTLQPSLVVAAGIIILLAGMTTVGAADDAISGHYVTAAARVFEVAMLTLGIVVGIAAVLDIAQRAGAPLDVVDVTSPRLPIAGQIVAGAMVAGCWAVAAYARPRAVLVVSGVGGLGLMVSHLAGGLGLGPAVGSGIAALVVGVVSEVVGSRVGVASLIVSSCGIVPLLPGLVVYRALFSLVEEAGDALPDLLGAGAIGLALAAGVALGEFIATPLRAGLDRWDRRVRNRAIGTRD